MFECPGCGANLHFSPGLNMLKCPYCDTLVATENDLKNRSAGEIRLKAYDFMNMQDIPWENKEEETAEYDGGEETPAGEEETSVYNQIDMTIYTCSQCGAELLTDDATAATFCSYCGSSLPLNSRLTKAKKPRYILPFSITKEEAVQRYRAFMKKKFFAQSDSDEKITEKLRGIYMPFWLYTVKAEKDLRRELSKTTVNVDYDLVTYYKGSCLATAEYNNIAFDASSSFYDEISQAVMPYFHEHLKGFDLNYMSGFYADTADVDPDIYDTEILRTINKDLTKDKQKQFFAGYDISGDFQNVYSYSDLNIQKRELVYLPVWFMSRKVGKRVSYAAINGDSGKVWADMPLSMGKYLMAALAIAIGLFLSLNYLTLIPEWTLGISLALALIILYHINAEADMAYYHENLYTDIGFVSKMDAYQKSIAKWELERMRGSSERENKFVRLLIILTAHLLPFVIAFLGFWILGGGVLAAEVLFENGVYIIGMGLAIREFFKGILIKVEPKPSAPFKAKFKYFIKPILCLIIGLSIMILKPAEDYFYYGANVLLLVMLIFSVGDLVAAHNILTSRRLPQLNKRGGEEDERY